MHLIGKRIVIRDFTLNDASDYLAYASDPRVTESAGMRPAASQAKTKQILQQFIMSASDFAIEYQGHVIGNIGAYPRTGDPDSPDAWTREIGYALARPFWGQGFMTEALTLFCDFLFENGMTAIWAAAFPDNQRSLQLLRRQGFEYRFTIALPAGLSGNGPRQEVYYRRLRHS
ncbi:GNAT family N-acetyltransferase [Lacticaseibacillus sp. GG6-2]